MTTEKITAQGMPGIDHEVFQIGRTTRAAHLAVLAQAANEALHQSPGQVLTFGGDRRVCSLGTVLSAFFLPAGSVAKYLRVSFAMGWLDATRAISSITAHMTVYDTLGNIYNGEAPFDGSVYFVPPDNGSHLRSTNVRIGYVDVDAAVTAGLDATLPWRIEFELAEDASDVNLRWLCVEELPRWIVDDAEAYGVLVGSALPNQPIRDDGQLERLLVTLEHAETHCCRTHLSLCTDQGGYYILTTDTAPAWVGGTSYNPGDFVTYNGTRYRCNIANNAGAPSDSLSDVGGAADWSTICYATQSNGVNASLLNLEEAAGDEILFWTRARKTTGAGTSRLRVCVRYKVDGNDANLRMVTSEGAYDFALPDTAGAWTDTTFTTGYLDTDAADLINIISFLGYQDGTHQAELCTITVTEYPAV